MRSLRGWRLLVDRAEERLSRTLGRFSGDHGSSQDAIVGASARGGAEALQTTRPENGVELEERGEEEEEECKQEGEASLSQRGWNSQDCRNRKRPRFEKRRTGLRMVVRRLEDRGSRRKEGGEEKGLSQLDDALVARLLQFGEDQFVWHSSFATLEEALRSGPGNAGFVCRKPRSFRSLC